MICALGHDGLKIVNYKKFDAVCHVTTGQKPSVSLQRLLRIVICKAVQALTALCQHILNTCTVLNCVTLLKFHILQ